MKKRPKKSEAATNSNEIRSSTILYISRSKAHGKRETKELVRQLRNFILYLAAILIALYSLAPVYDLLIISLSTERALVGGGMIFPESKSRQPPTFGRLIGVVFFGVS